jgi:hypothetical protein
VVFEIARNVAEKRSIFMIHDIPVLIIIVELISRPSSVRRIKRLESFINDKSANS